jgi:hypothetical protein
VPGAVRGKDRGPHFRQGRARSAEPSTLDVVKVKKVALFLFPEKSDPAAVGRKSQGSVLGLQILHSPAFEPPDSEFLPGVQPTQNHVVPPVPVGHVRQAAAVRR